MYSLLGDHISGMEIGEPITASTYISPSTERVLLRLSDHIIMTDEQLRHTCWGTGNRDAKKRLRRWSEQSLLQRYELKGENKTITAYTLGATGCQIVKRGVPEFNLQKAAELIAFNQFYMAYRNEVQDYQAWVGNDLLIGQIKIKNKYYSVWCPRQEDLRVQSLKSEVALGNGLLVIAATMPLLYWCTEVLKPLPVEQLFTVDALIGVKNRIVMQMEDDLLTQIEF